MNNLRRLIPYVTPHKKALGIVLFLTILSGMFDAGFVYLVEKVVKPIIDSQSDSRLSQLNVAVGMLLAFSVVRACVTFGQQFLAQRIGQRVLFDLRETLYNHLQGLSISFFERRRTGEVMSRMTNDVSALQAVLTTSVLQIGAAPIAFILLVGYMFYTNWKLSLLVVLLMPPLSFLITRGGRLMKSAVRELQGQQANVANYLQEKIAAMRLIQTFGTNDYERALFKETNEATFNATMRPIRVSTSLGPMIELTGLSGVVLCLWFGGREVVNGSMSAAALTAFVFSVHSAAQRAKAISNVNLSLKTAEAAAGRLWEVFDTAPEVVSTPGATKLDKAKVEGRVKFENVDFAYGENAPVLHNISFDVAPGEVVALVGLTGSGKSTIASLLPRLYDPTQGRITLDGRDLRDVDLQSLRDLIGVVPQDMVLFHGTIRSNIAYGNTNATLDEITQAARRAHADEFIRQLPQGYDAPVGERGGGFSGGQRQRLAIARALLRDPKLLILDEATSALDAESEGLVQDALNELMKGRTTLVIAHRFSTIVGADRIIVLDKGRILESGSHHELLARKGQYWRLYQMQAFEARRAEVDKDPIEEAQKVSDAA